MEPRSIAILGGSGRTGEKIAESILRDTPYAVILCARSAGRLVDAKERLSVCGGAERVVTITCDADVPRSVRSALREVDIVVVAMPTRGLEHSLPAALIRSGVDVIDISLWPPTTEAYGRLDATAGCEGRRILSQAGLIPGIPALMVSRAMARRPDLRRIRLAEAMNLPPLTPGASASELIASVVGRPHVFRKGTWQRARSAETVRIDFGVPYGVRVCYPFDLAELRSLPNRHGLEELACYSSGFGGSADRWFLLALLPGATRTERILDWISRRVVRAINRTAQPPFGICLKLDGWAEETGLAPAYTLCIRSDDPYLATGAAVVAALRQLVAGHLPGPGSFLMGEALDAEEALADLEQMDVEVIESGAA